MFKITTQHLSPKYNYVWKAQIGDNPKLNHKPDSYLLNRKEWYEIVAFIEKVARELCIEIRNENQVSAFERIIQEGAPKDIRSQHELIIWFKNKLQEVKNKKIINNLK